jgi:hypothetical protein
MKALAEYREDYEGDEPKKRRPYMCHNGLCGALDCITCHPEIANEQEDEE